ncbi:MAG: hypothetical protein DMF91_24340, partial [Acidobacteria bacterium]
TTLGRGSLISAPRLPHFVFKLLLQRLHPCYEHIARFLNGAAVSAQLLLKEVGETDVSSRFGVSSRERRLIGLPSEARDGLRRSAFALRATADILRLTRERKMAERVGFEPLWTTWIL